MKKILIPLIVTIFIVYGIYNFYREDKINYVALGDSLAIGENPYGEIGYGYSDNIKEYLNSKDKLKSYTKDYAKSGDTTKDLINKIKSNKKVTINNEKIGIKRALRESDIVTISIGANDLLDTLNVDDMSLFNGIDYEKVSEDIELITKDVQNAIQEIKKYAKKDIILIGYYNPVNKNILDDEELDKLIEKSDQLLTEICGKEEIVYIKISDIFKYNSDLLPNPFNIHPNYKGYEAISNEIIEYLEKTNKKLA